jgi:hypothetical protein
LPVTVIEIDDKHAAALRAKAEAQGLTLEAWLKSLAGEVATLNAPPLLGRPPTAFWNCKSA